MGHQLPLTLKMSQTSTLIQILQKRILRFRQFHAAVKLHADSSSSSDSDSDNEKKLSQKKETYNENKPVINQLTKKFKSQKPKVNVSVYPKKQKLQEIKTTKASEKPLEENIVSAIKNIIANMETNSKSQVESDLLTTIKKINKGKESVSFESVSNILSNMKIEQKKSDDRDVERLPKNKSTMKRQPYRRNLEKKSNLFEGKGLSIFSHEQSSSANVPKMSTWQLLEQLELKYNYAQPPRNMFQQLINWTEEGKLWYFPINNEQGLIDEQNVHFSEHVFLDRHLKDWCPKSGPIRHFMELVCVGLSKNPYLTIEEKYDHLKWFKDYFNQHAELLKTVGVITDEPKPKQLEI